MHLQMERDADPPRLTRLANLLGVAALSATDRLRESVESELAHGGSAPGALVHIQAWPGESIEALRCVLGISQPATVRVVDRLAEDGLVERRPGPDRRSLALHLTPAGERAAHDLLRRRARALEELLGALSGADQAALEPLLEQLVATLAEDRPGALRTCRLCDRDACKSLRGCPLDHTMPPSP
jgi:DNA-binding MarR family transcriptional regulator